jgi:hypothetical protein
MRPIARDSFVSTALLCASLALGCETTRPMANHGVDVIENPGRTFLVRGPAAVGAMAGYVLAVPISVCLLPTYFWDDAVVDTAQGYGEGAVKGDIFVPLVLAPYDYGAGIGAAVAGWPFEHLEGLFGRDTPGAPPYTTAETQELPPGRPDPERDFTVRPPVGSLERTEQRVLDSLPDSPGATIEGDDAVDDPALEPRMPGEQKGSPEADVPHAEFLPDPPDSP